MIYFVDDLYPRDNPRDGARLLRFTKHQKAHYEGVRNGTGSGEIVVRGTTSDAAAIDPQGLQYVRKRRINTAVLDAATPSGFSEKVVGGYWFEQGDFLALDRKRLKTLSFGGAGTLAYLDREIMWSHSYLDELGHAGTMDPFDRIWRLWAQGDWAGGDYLGAVLWRVVSEGLAHRIGATYTHRHATPDEFGVEFTDSHADDKLETAIPYVTLGFDQFVDSSGNAWSVDSGEFEASVGESLYEVTKRLMEAGLYVELDPDTFELRAWEVANHGRDRTGLAWGADVVRFEPPPDPSTDRADGNILDDLKRTLRPFIRVTALLAGGGEDTYAVATASGAVPWHRHYPADVNNVAALGALASRQIGSRNDAGDTVLVRSKVGNDPSNGYYLPEEHAKLDDLVTMHSGTGTWDWDESAYPIAKWSVTSRRTGAPDVFYHLGASYHAAGGKEFAGGAGVGRHTHPPNPRLCSHGFGNVACEALDSSMMAAIATPNGDLEDAGGAQPSGGTYSTSHRRSGSRGYAAIGVSSWDVAFSLPGTFRAGRRYVVEWYSGQDHASSSTVITFGTDADNDNGWVATEQVTGADGRIYDRNRICWTPSADRTGVRLRYVGTQAGTGDFYLDDVSHYQVNGAVMARVVDPSEAHPGTSNMALRCDVKIPHTLVHDLADMGDVDLDGLANADVLVWNASAGKWEPGSAGSVEHDHDELAPLVHAHGSPAAGFHGVLLYRDSDFATAFSNDSIPNWTGTKYDTDGAFDPGEPDGWTTPAAWDGRVGKIGAWLAWLGFTSGSNLYVEAKIYADAVRPIGDDQEHKLVWGGVMQHHTNPASPFVFLETPPIPLEGGKRYTLTLKTGEARTAHAYEEATLYFGGWLVEPGEGEQGPAGEGVPVGGAEGQILAKATATDHDTEWIDPPSGSGSDTAWVVDPGAPTYDDSDPDEVSISLLAKFGIDGSGDPYYNDAGALAGEEAALVWDSVAGEYQLRPYYP